MSPPSRGPRRPRDPGLQPERTALAWNRTAIAFAVNAALVLRAGLVGDAPLFVAVGAVLALAAGAATAYSAVRKRQLLRAAATQGPPALALALAASATLLASAAGTASILTTR